MTTTPTPGFVLWLTGMSGPGKSILSECLAARSPNAASPWNCSMVESIYRRGSASLAKIAIPTSSGSVSSQSYSRVDRVIAIVAAISPYRDTRARARALAAQFVEVRVDCSLEDLEERDVKGLYARARAGEIERFIGISDPYEAPEQPEIRVNSSTQTIEQSLAEILAWLADQELILPG